MLKAARRMTEVNEERDFFESLKEYGFKDDMGHPLEMCAELKEIEHAIRQDHAKRMTAIAPGVRLGDHIQVHGRTLVVDLWYPRSDDEFNAVQVGLCDVRASDDLLIEYDFDRDGWVIKQEAGKAPDTQWQEVYFAQAWALEPEGSDD